MSCALRGTLLIAGILLGACTDDGICHIGTLGDLPVLNARSFPIVRASVNGHPAAFIIDTGARLSTIWPKEADKLNLDISFNQVRLHGTGGETMGGIATADTLSLGSATAKEVSFVTAGTLFDGHTIGDLPVIGLFGADFLSNYTVVLDLPDRRISLYQMRGCTNWRPGWKGRYYRIPVDHDPRDETKIVMRLRLNGHPVDAYLDSGSNATLIAREDARRAGIRKDDLRKDRTGVGFGIDDEKTTRYLHRFDSLDIGPFHYAHPSLAVGETDTSLLGADFLRHHRVWIPRDADWIYVQSVKPQSHAQPGKILGLSQKDGLYAQAGHPDRTERTGPAHQNAIAGFTGRE